MGRCFAQDVTSRDFPAAGEADLRTTRRALHLPLLQELTLLLAKHFYNRFFVSTAGLR